MKGYLVWKDGRREPTSVAGGNWIHYPLREDDGRMTEVLFKAEDVEADGSATVLVYHEHSRSDRTAEYARAEEENRARTWDFIRRAWKSAACRLRGCKCACHREAP